MRIKTISYKPFELRFAGAFGTGRASLSQREGCIIRLESDTGITGLGEASPLPEFGGGTRDDVIRLLEEWQPKLTGRSVEAMLDEVAVSGPGAAAFLCGLDTARADVLAHSENISVAEWLAGGPVAKSVPVNATVGAPSDVAAAETAQKAVQDGFECVKLKVGMASTVQAEIARVRGVRTAIGDKIRLRLDANGAWTVTQAIQTLQELEVFEIELVEQPVAAHDLVGMAQVRQAVRMPIAADEAVTDIAAARAIIAACAADILVIKPMVVGGLRAGREIIKLAQSAGLQTFVTTTIDSGVGIAAALHLAATLPEPVLHCGLATAFLLEDTLVHNLPEIRVGRMFLPDEPGLGVRL